MLLSYWSLSTERLAAVGAEAASLDNETILSGLTGVRGMAL